MRGWHVLASPSDRLQREGLSPSLTGNAGGSATGPTRSGALAYVKAMDWRVLSFGNRVHTLLRAMMMRLRTRMRDVSLKTRVKMRRMGVHEEAPGVR